MQNNYNEALKYYKQACIFEEILNNTGSFSPEEESAKTINHLGSYQFKQGNYRLALEYFSKSLELTPHENKDGLARVHNNIGLCLTQTQHYKEALKHFHDSLVIKENEDHVKMDSVARTLGNMANCYLKLNEIQSALECQRACLSAKNQFYGHIENEDVASSYYNIGYCYSLMGQEKEAIKNFDTALKVRTAVLGKSHISISQTLLGMANASSDPDTKYRLLNEALEIAKKCSKGHDMAKKIRSALNTFQKPEVPEQRKVTE